MNALLCFCLLFVHMIDPVLYQGRVRPANAYAYELSRDMFGQTLKEPSALLWSMHQQGHEPWDDELLFVISRPLRKTLDLDHKRAHFSYNELKIVLDAPSTLRQLALAAFKEAYEKPGRLGNKLPLGSLSDQLWAAKRGDRVVVTASPFSTLPAGTTIGTLQQARPTDEITALWYRLQLYENPEQFFPPPGSSISSWRLQIERLFYTFPIPLLLAVAYLLTAILLWCLPWWILTIPLTAHGLFLALRCYLLQRPPVADMIETLLWVSWVTAILGLVLRKRVALLAATIGASALLFFAAGSPHLENVQAVLRSNFWLTTHVLLVVGSYGAFLLAALLGHVDLLQRARGKTPLPTRLLLHPLFFGTAMLISGTLLGGVWAAQSWGRFWDWDPKESWAFISICAYLVAIHAYFFGLITARGLAALAAIGFLVISFTWYGVNYILATGLHSYGFGHGGTWLYVCCIVVDTSVISLLYGLTKKKRAVEQKT